MNRFDLLEKLQESLKDKLVICNIGLPSQELYKINDQPNYCLLYTSPSPRDRTRSRMPSSA